MSLVMNGHRAGFRKKKVAFGKAKAAAVASGKRSLVATIKRVAREDEEIKRLFAGIAQETAGTTAVSLLNGVAQGDGSGDRAGNKVKPIGIRVRVCFAPIAATTIGSHGQWYIIWDRQPNQTALTNADVMSTGGIDDPGLAFRSVGGIDRFRILCLRQINTGTATGSGGQDWEEYIDLSKIKDKMRYSGSGATIASIATGSLYFVYVMSDQTGLHPATNQPVMSMSSCFTFTDA